MALRSTHGQMGADHEKYTLTPTPMEVVLPGRDLPRHARVGLAVFHLAHSGDHIPPAILQPSRPLLEMEGLKVAVVDVPVGNVTKLFEALAESQFQQVLIRDPTRSPLSTSAFSRMVINLVYPSGTADLVILTGLQRLRTLAVGADLFFGLRDLIGASDALILEIGNAASFRHYWPLCSQAIALSPTKLAVYSGAEPATWTASMDAVLSHEADDATARLKWKASRLGGRTVAAPSATPAALAAARRGGNRRITSYDYTATVSLEGEVGKQDNEILCRLMHHVVTTTGLQLRPAQDPAMPRVGEFFRVQAAEPTAKPGVMKLLLADLEEVRRVRGALHGQTVKVGSDIIAIRVGNDVVDAGPVPGSELRRQH